MTNIVSIERLFKDSQLIYATRDLVQGAMLEPSCREGLILILWQGFKDQPFKLVGGFVGDNQMYLRLQSRHNGGLLYVCDLPKEYRGKPVTEIHPFDKKDIRRVLAMTNISWMDEHYLT